MADSEPAAATGKILPTRLLITLSLFVSSVGGGALWFNSRRHAAHANTTAGAEPRATVKSVVHLESFVVNLADSDRTAFLKIGIDLGTSQVESKSEDKTSVVVPKLRDVILGVLGSCQSSDLLAPDGKQKLKEQLVKALHDQTPEASVQEVYFTEFLVQR